MYIFCREYFHHDSIVKYILRLIEKKYRVFSSSTSLPRQFIDLSITRFLPLLFLLYRREEASLAIDQTRIHRFPSPSTESSFLILPAIVKNISRYCETIFIKTSLYMQINGGHAELLIIMNDRRRSKIRCREGGPLGSYFIPISSPVPRLIDIFFHTRLSLNSSSVDLRAGAPFTLSISLHSLPTTPLPFSLFHFVFIKCIVRISIYLFPRNNAPTATGGIIDARPRGRGIRSSRRKKPRALFLTFSLSLSFSFSFSRYRGCNIN